MKNFKEDNWPSNMNFENFDEDKTLDFSEDLLDDCREALNRFYQKETRRCKTAKRRKQAWQ